MTVLPPPPGPDPDAAARRALQEHRNLATGLLVAMALLTLATYRMPPGLFTDILQASAKAGFVGGVADWFAVTALFRHPLGLPIPHTAIIPNQKERLGRALGRFVAGHVFTREDVARFLQQIDLPGIVRRFLADPATRRPAAEAMAAMLPRFLRTLEDGRARHVLARLAPRLLGGPGAGRLVSQALGKLVEGGKHQDVFSFILGSLKATLTSREGALKRAIEDRVAEQGGKLVGWAIGAAVAHKVIGTINAELARMEPDSSEMRAAFDEWVRREISRIETDPARATEIGATIRGVVAHETIRVWLADVWHRLRDIIETDVTRQDGHTVAFIEGALANLGTMIEHDPDVRARLQAAAGSVAGTLLPAAQVQLATFIGDVVARWDAETVTDKLELRVGRDLQYVRINGTIVGFLVGGTVYVVLHALFGSVSF
ncbi:conserved protein of unknown function [Rhodovastum atsumiense]|uniref:DUF445 domain-containing protein n=1 Tax=Rhodovastum atsumiense TaxID=504468 RepID=A0A5M6ITK9_9PROT|nr:DUF445 domain-containing protein [Rhodovastum atsumiense]KAA5610785.1 DUF445 domain-containing protein [Rhodovastum atsumiense]CAH2604455.1 conserved protein of unknown function [Rhodovastum atsumiense]